jgi:cytochrome c
VDVFNKKHYLPSLEQSGVRPGSGRMFVPAVAIRTLSRALLATTFLTSSPVLYASDETAARDLAQSSGCFKCHAVDKKKDGPALRDVAAKYKGVADAETKLIYHVTSGEMVKFDDGHEEHHKKVKTDNQKDTLNLVQWILTLPGGTKPPSP